SRLSADVDSDLLHVAQTIRDFSGQAQSEGQDLIIHPSHQVQAAQTDIDGFAQAVIALLIALTTKGTSILRNIDPLDGRFEALDERLAKLGAKIERQEQPDQSQ